MLDIFFEEYLLFFAINNSEREGLERITVILLTAWLNLKPGMEPMET